MKLAPLHLPLSILSLAAASLLSACGGGDALPPGSATVVPAAAGPDIVAPTLSIVSSAAGTTATGDVTFTFNFNESVGDSFTADDVVVTGGTKGSFTRVSLTQATLVVTPLANTNSVIEVSVAALQFADAAGNRNTALVSLQQAYNTVPAPTVPGSTGTCTAAPCIAFDAVGLAMVSFGGLAADVVADPALVSNKVVRLVKSAAAETWAGATVDPSGTGAASVPAFGFATNKTVTLRVLSGAAGETIMLKVESAADSAVNMEAQAVTTQANVWETLTFNYAAPTAGTYDASKTYDRVSVFPHFGSKVTADATYYIDELKYTGVAAVGTGAGTVLISFDEATAPKLTDFGTNGAGAAIVADPAGGTNKVLKINKYALPAPGSEQWAGTTISTGAADSIPAIPFSATAKTMSVRVYSPAAGVRVRLKVEDAANPGVSCETDALTTTAGAWETLTFDFANPAKSPPVTGGATSALDLTKTYNKASIFMDFGLGNGGSGPLPANRIYYVDDISFGGTVAAATATATRVDIVRSNAAGTPAYDAANGQALPGAYATGHYSAGAGEASWWGGNYAEQIQVGYGFDKNNAAQWGFGIFIQNGGTGWDISTDSNYHFTLGTNIECVGVCKVTVRLVAQPAGACVADAKLTLTAADITTAYTVPLSSFTVTGCTTNTMAAFKALKVAELHFQMLHDDMQFVTSGDPVLYPNGLGVGGGIYFD